MSRSGEQRVSVVNGQLTLHEQAGLLLLQSSRGAAGGLLLAVDHGRQDVLPDREYAVEQRPTPAADDDHDHREPEEHSSLRVLLPAVERSRAGPLEHHAEGVRQGPAAHQATRSVRVGWCIIRNGGATGDLFGDGDELDVEPLRRPAEQVERGVVGDASASHQDPLGLRLNRAPAAVCGRCAAGPPRHRSTGASADAGRRVQFPPPPRASASRPTSSGLTTSGRS